MADRIALVTGGNGFVGCHVVRALLARGDRVRVLVREAADLAALKGVECERVIGDLRDRDSIIRAAKGCEEIYHVAADYRLWVEDEEPMYASNVLGTRNVLEAARRAGVRRMIHTSTVGALGVPHDSPGCEDTAVTLDDMVGPYKRSKFMAERDVLAAAREGIPVVVVNRSDRGTISLRRPAGSSSISSTAGCRRIWTPGSTSLTSRTLRVATCWLPSGARLARNTSWAART
jgi:dihydroflavonol-4-reductase